MAVISVVTLIALAFDHLGHARLQRRQAAGDGIAHQLGGAHPKLATFAKLTASAHRFEKFIHFLHRFGREPNPIGVARDSEKAFLRARIIKALHGNPEPVLGNADADMSRGRLLDRVRFI